MTSRAPKGIEPDFAIERLCWEFDLRHLAGVDEVGRGALAGPLVSAAVVFDPNILENAEQFAGLTDSKQLTAQQRDVWFDTILATAAGIGVGMVDNVELDAIGVGPANRIAMERAVLELATEPDMLLLDATTVDLGLPQVGFIDGDALCLSIAAASIVAKVTRDRMMIAYGELDGRYSFGVHKGYGTALHLDALRRHGPCDIHRRCFAPVAACMGER